MIGDNLRVYLRLSFRSYMGPEEADLGLAGSVLVAAYGNGN